MNTLDIQTLIRNTLCNGRLKAPKELDQRIKDMLLELRIIASELNTASNCSQQNPPPYRKRMIHYKGKSISVCEYITFEQVDNLRKRTCNTKICPYQGTSVLPVFRRRKDLEYGREPLPKYECRKMGRK